MFHNLDMRGITKEELLNGNIIKGLIKLSLPLMVLNLINTLYSIVDTYFVGQIGELQVGAVSLVSPIMNCGVAFSGGLCAAGIAMISRSIGANDKEKANNIATHLIELCFILGIGIGAICIIYADNILLWLDTPIDIYQDTYNYFIGISFDYLFLFILSVFQCIRQSNGDSKTGVKLNSIAAILNTILDPIFIFYFNLGTFGAALATFLSKAIMTPIALMILFKDKEYTTISFKKYPFKFKTLVDIIKIAIPASLGQFLTSFGFVMMSKNIVAYGSIAMSAYGIGTKISSIFYIPVNGIGSALSTYIGQNLGANNPARARKCFKEAMKVMSCIAIVLTGVGILSAKSIINIFINNASDLLLAMALEYTYYSICTSFFMGWFQNFSGVFDGSGNTTITMILSTLRLWGIRIPMIYLLGKYTNIGVTGIWLAMVVSNGIICVLGQIIYFIYPWDKKGARI